MTLDYAETALITASLQASVRGLFADGIADLRALMARLNQQAYEIIVVE